MTDRKKRKRTSHPILRFIQKKILHADDSAHKIALGVAVGVFIAWSPLLGLHIAMILVLCILLDANKFVAFTSTCISNVFTLVLIYYPSYLLGWFVLNIFRSEQAMSKEEVMLLFRDVFSVTNFIRGFYQSDYWLGVWGLVKNIGPELWVGSFILGSVAAVSSYMIFYHLVKYQRSKRPHRRFARHQ